jgi:hypothetical protein
MTHLKEVGTVAALFVSGAAFPSCVHGRTRHAAKHDSRAVTEKARRARFKKYLDQVEATTPGLTDDERHRRAEHLRRADMIRLSLKSSRTRAARKAGRAL